MATVGSSPRRRRREGGGHSKAARGRPDPGCALSAIMASGRAVLAQSVHPSSTPASSQAGRPPRPPHLHHLGVPQLFIHRSCGAAVVAHRAARRGRRLRAARVAHHRAHAAGQGEGREGREGWEARRRRGGGAGRHCWVLHGTAALHNPYLPADVAPQGLLSVHKVNLPAPEAADGWAGGREGRGGHERRHAAAGATVRQQPLLDPTATQQHAQRSYSPAVAKVGRGNGITGRTGLCRSRQRRCRLVGGNGGAVRKQGRRQRPGRRLGQGAGPLLLGGPCAANGFDWGRLVRRRLTHVGASLQPRQQLACGSVHSLVLMRRERGTAWSARWMAGETGGLPACSWRCTLPSPLPGESARGWTD